MLSSFLWWGLMLVLGFILFCIANLAWSDIRVNRVRFEYLQRRVCNDLGDRAKFRIKPGDEIWWYSTPACTWTWRCGRAGYAQIRRGKIIRKKLILMN